MAGDLPIWILRYAELLGCDDTPAAIAVAIEDLLRSGNDSAGRSGGCVVATRN